VEGEEAVPDTGAMVAAGVTAELTREREAVVVEFVERDRV
jgi:hypothetical protein